MIIARGSLSFLCPKDKLEECIPCVECKIACCIVHCVACKETCGKAVSARLEKNLNNG